MATAASAVLEDRRQKVTTLESEISNLREKLAAEATDLSALLVERGDLAEQIALGQAPASKAREVAKHIEEIETRVAGFNSILARRQAQLDRLWPELRILETETKLAARRAEIELLKTNGQKIVTRLNENLARIIAEDLPGLDAIRDKLTQDYRDIGGQCVAADLCRTLLTEGGALTEEDKLTNMRAWQTDPPRWKMRGDVVLTLRNLWPPAKH